MSPSDSSSADRPSAEGATPPPDASRRSPRRRATLASLAAELKVSRTTVSNAYNRPDQLSPELRERVLETARRLGYPGPDPVARSLRTRTAGAVGLVLTEELSYAVRDPNAAQFLAGFTQACGEVGQGVLLIPGGKNPSRRMAMTAVHRANVDSFVVYSVAEDDPYLLAARERPVPIVIVDQPMNIAGVHKVSGDDRFAMRAIADRIFDAGHRHVAVLSIRLAREPLMEDLRGDDLSLVSMDIQRQRLEAVRSSAFVHGVDPHSLVIAENFDNTMESGRETAARILREHPRITALICTSDVIAMGALAHARDARLRVPRDLSITGFDGVPEALALGLTTTQQPAEEKGRMAGALATLNDGAPKRHSTYTFEFIPGRTLGPPRGSV